MCDRAALLDHGKLCAVGSPGEVIEQYQASKRRNSRSDEKTNEEADSFLGQVPSGKRELSPEVLAMEKQAMGRDWFYQFELPSGSITNSYMQEFSRRIHGDRLAILDSILSEKLEGDFSKLTCLDVGCNQGYFSVEMAKRGFRKVLGFDARRENIEDANLMQEIYGLNNLRFRVADINKVSVNEIGQFDVVMAMSLLFWLENPIGALRALKALTRKMLIIETPVAPDLSGEIDWGNSQFQKKLNGSFALLDLAAESKKRNGSLTGLSLCPGRETLVWLMEKLGFSSVEVVTIPSDMHEQLSSGKRIVVVGRV